MIIDITEKDIKDVAYIHKNFLPSIICFYSLVFIEKFYNFHLQDKSEKKIFKGYKLNNRLVGFVFGMDNVENLFNKFIRSNVIFFIKETIIALLSHPQYLYFIITKIFERNETDKSNIQLVYIAVNKNIGIKGVGSTLLFDFEKELRNYDCYYYELEVEQNNTAFEFYRKNNFFIVKQIKNPLEKKFLLGKKLK